MKLVDRSVNGFIDEVDSKSPAPGGGSVAALAGSIGVSLARMVGHLTIGRKKFLALDEDIQKEFTIAFDKLDSLNERLRVLIDEDTLAYNKVMNAFRMPKDTDSEKSLRSKAIEDATYDAISVPLEISTLSLDALKGIVTICKYGNKNAITDCGVATHMLYSAIEGGILNVKINLGGISDTNYVDDLNKKCTQLSRDGNELKNSILEVVNNNI